MFCSTATAPAASSTSATTIDLRSTDSRKAAKHLEDSSAALGQSGPSTTPAVSGAGVVPDAPSSKVPGAIAPDAKPAAPGPPYLGWLDLGIEDKARFFDRIVGLVS